MIKLTLLLAISFFCALNVLAQFSSVQNGDWDNCATWGTCPGTAVGIDYPGRDDNVSISHAIAVNNTLDNATTETQPNDEAISGVCGCTGVGATGCQNTPVGCNTNSFFHNGKITIDNGGTLTTTVPTVFRGDVEVNSGGAFRLDANFQTFVIGRIDVRDGGSFISNRHLVISGNGILNVEPTATAGLGDDLYIDGDNSFVCGDGTLSLDGNAFFGGPRNNSIRLFNSSDNATTDQICSGSTVTCADGNCCGGQCSADIGSGAGAGDGQITPGDGTASPPAVLPVELIHFKGKESMGYVRLEWVTATELNNEGFEVHKSMDGKNFSAIAFVEGSGNSNEQISYLFEDRSPVSGANYYKLIQRDFDGKSESLGIIRVFVNVSKVFTVYPNPTKNDINIVPGNRFQNTSANIKMYNISGEIIFTQNKWIAESTLNISVNTIPGVYFVEVDNGTFHDRSTVVVQ